jgi:hypothetical protein
LVVGDNERSEIEGDDPQGGYPERLCRWRGRREPH